MGNVGQKYSLEGGCCYPDVSAAPNPNLAKIAMVKDLTIAIGGGLMLDVLINAGVKKGVLAAKGSKAAATTAKAAKAGRMAATSIKVAATAGKGAAAVGKYAMAAAEDPLV